MVLDGTSGVVRHIIGIVLVLVLVHSLVGPCIVLSLMFVRSWPFVVVPKGVGIGDGVGSSMFVIGVGIVPVLVLAHSLVGLCIVLLVDAHLFVAVRCLHHAGVGLGVFVGWRVCSSDVGSFMVFVDVVGRSYSCGRVASGLVTGQVSSSMKHVCWGSRRC